MSILILVCPISKYSQTALKKRGDADVTEWMVIVFVLAALKFLVLVISSVVVARHDYSTPTLL